MGNVCEREWLKVRSWREINVETCGTVIINCLRRRTFIMQTSPLLDDVPEKDTPLFL